MQWQQLLGTRVTTALVTDQDQCDREKCSVLLDQFRFRLSELQAELTNIIFEQVFQWQKH